MDILIKGGENKGAIAALIRSTKITSENKINAIYGYYVNGYSQVTCTRLYHVDQPSLTKSIKTIEQAARHASMFMVLSNRINKYGG